MAFNLKTILIAVAIPVAAVAMIADGGGIGAIGGKSDGKLQINGVTVDARKTDWDKIDKVQFGLRPTTEGTGPAIDEEYAAVKSAINRDDNVVAVLTGDEKIEQAIEKARQTMPRFFELMEAKTQGSYLIKYRLEDEGMVEHIWVQLTDMDGDNFVGLLSNEPAVIKNYKMGDQVTVPRDKVSDWMIKTESEIYGGYTMRVLLDDLPKDQAAALQAMLRD